MCIVKEKPISIQLDSKNLSSSGYFNIYILVWWTHRLAKVFALSNVGTAVYVLLGPMVQKTSTGHNT